MPAQTSTIERAPAVRSQAGPVPRSQRLADPLTSRSLRDPLAAGQLTDTTMGAPTHRGGVSAQAAQPSTIQRVVYADVDYGKNKAGFVEKARKDLELNSHDDNSEVLRTLDELKEHDATTVIDDVQHLKRLIHLDASTPEDRFLEEYRVVGQSCETMAEFANRLAEFRGGPKSDPQTWTADVQKQVKILEAVPIQAQGLDKTSKAMEALSNTLRSAKETIPESGKPLNTINKAGRDVKDWAVGFPQTFVRSMRKWRIKATIGAVGPKGSYLAIGPKSDTLGKDWADQDKRGAVIRAEPWSPGINDTWLKSGIRTELPFQLTQEPPDYILEPLRTGDRNALRLAFIRHANETIDVNDRHYWDTRTNTFTRYGVELDELLSKGYRLDED